MIRYHSAREQNVYTNSDHFPPISRTMRYKKVTKPLLERKRRARINRCLDELKDLVGALEADGENINKLEKADILELTVRHLKKISRLQDPVQEAHRFQAGFTRCASEACTFLFSLPGMNSAVGKRLVEHLKQCISKQNLAYIAPASTESRVPSICSPTSSPSSSPLPLSAPYEQYQQHTLASIASHLRNANEVATIAGAENEDSNSSNESINSMWRPW